jgi:AcrR family transcriptional regulator
MVFSFLAYSKTTLYSHWPSRLDLFKAALGALSEPRQTHLSGDPRTDLVACPSLMFGAVPQDDVVETAVDIVLKSAVLKSAGR